MDLNSPQMKNTYAGLHQIESIRAIGTCLEKSTIVVWLYFLIFLREFHWKTTCFHCMLNVSFQIWRGHFTNTIILLLLAPRLAQLGWVFAPMQPIAWMCETDYYYYGVIECRGWSCSKWIWHRAGACSFSICIIVSFEFYSRVCILLKAGSCLQILTRSMPWRNHISIIFRGIWA